MIFKNKKEKFLSSFKKLETKLRTIANSGDGTYFSSILDIVESKNYVINKKRQVIQDLYALRNVIAHKNRDRYLVEINDIAFEEINNIIKLLNNPPRVIGIFKTNVFTANTDDSTEDVVKTMNKKIYTHIPIYHKGKYIGTFSENTILSWLADNIKQGQADFRKSRIFDINRKYLNSANDRIDFISEDTDIFTAKKKFDFAIRKGYRLGALYIAPNGNKSIIPPTGIITAYDLSKIDDYIN